MNPTTAKNGNPRTLKISQQLTESINEWIIKNNLSLIDRLFKGDSEDYGKYYRSMRNKLAKDLKDPSIHTIRLYDFRHYFCSKQLNDTKDPYFVMIQMGHGDAKRPSPSPTIMSMISIWISGVLAVTRNARAR